RLFRKQPQRLPLRIPQPQLTIVSLLPALHLAQRLEEAPFLFHQGWCAHHAGGAGLAEAQLIARGLVGGEPAVAAGVTMGAAVVGEGDGDVAAVDQWAIADPFHLVGGVQRQARGGGGGAAGDKQGGGQGESQGFAHGLGSSGCWLHVGVFRRWRGSASAALSLCLYRSQGATLVVAGRLLN